MDAALEKVRERTRRRSVSERRGRDEDSGRRLSSLIPRRRKSRVKTGRDEFGRTLSATSSNPNLVLANNRSETSLDRNGSGNSSLLTDDYSSDAERLPTRPTLSPHQSHIGYLTLSSPAISTVQSSSASDTNSTFNPLIGGCTPNIPHIIEPPTDEADSTSSAKERNTSPIERLRAALSRNQSGSSVESAGDGAIEKENLVDPFTRPSSSTPALVGSSARERDVLNQVGAESQSKASARPSRPSTPKNKSGRLRLNPGALPTTPPSIQDTPQTLVTPPTPTDINADAATFSRPPSASARISSPNRSLGTALHRRSQSANVPSKLSQSIAAPLTPTTEEIKTPGGTLTTGFFTSFMSAAQKAADQFNLGSGGPFSPNAKGKENNARPREEGGGEEVIPGPESRPDLQGYNSEERPLAVETLGRGNLNFSHLGIVEGTASDTMVTVTDMAQQNASVTVTETNKLEEEAANRAVSAAYETALAPAAPVSRHTRPQSIASIDRLTLGEQTPPRVGTDVGALQRSGSVRSRLSGRRRRHRASSATAGTSNSIGAALAASATGLANPAVNGVGHRLTGFAVASSKRNRDFHQQFRSVPEDDYLIEDYSAALQRDILLHGRLYISEGHICFFSNILGWVTNLVISFDEIVSVEKRNTAVIFPNAIAIQTLTARNVFASLVTRDSTYELLIGIWKISHPNLRSSLNGVTLDDAGTGDKTEVADAEVSDGDDDESGSEDEVYDEDDDNDAGSFADAATAPSVADSDVVEPTLSRKPSGIPVGNGSLQLVNGAPKAVEVADATATGGTPSADFPGPATHEPSSCADEHYDRPIANSIIAAPVGKIYSLMFGPASGAFMKRWLVDDQKSRELNYQGDKTGIDNEHKSFTFDYIKPLNAPVGPRQTKCITTNTVMAFDLEKAVTIDCSTATPDVPSGNAFVTKTRYCLMWAPENSTRLVATCTIEWSGKSWLKGPIEKGANDGQIDYVKSLTAALSQAATSKAATAKAVGKKGKRKGRKETFDAEAPIAQRDPSIASEKQKSDWGLFEPLHPLLEPIFSLIHPFTSPHVLIAVLFVLLMYTWTYPPYGSRGRSVGFSSVTPPERLAAYEEIWRREESHLWDWLEDRVGLDGGYAPGVDGRQKVLALMNGLGMGKKLEDQRMTERQVDDAIRITEQRLEALKEAVARKKRG